MKKLFALMAALILALGCSSLAEEAEDMMALQESWLYESLTNTGWTEKNGDRVTLDVEPNLDGTAQFRVLVAASNGADESVQWTYFCNYNLDIHVLFAVRAVCNKVVFADGSSEPETTCLCDRESSAFFELDEDGVLVLRDPDAGDDAEYELYLMDFIKVPGEEKGLEVTEAIRTVCEQKTENMLGVVYTPLKILAEEETRICVLCESTVVCPDAKPCFALLYLDSLEDGETGVVLLTDDGSEG